MKTALAAFATACAALCATTAQAQTHRRAPAGPSAQDIQLAQNLRWESDEMERRLVRSGIRNSDSALNEFVHRVGCNIAAARCGELRFYVVEDSEFNASVLPNGMMLVNSGLLLRVESEAELAFVMAHEFGHYSLDHTLARVHAIRNASTSGLILTTVLGFAGAGALSTLGYLPSVAGALAFTRDQEHDADLFAAGFANDHDYDSHAGVRAWQNLSTEVHASSNDTTRRRFTQRSMFATHPLTADRITYLTAVADAHPGAGDDKAAYRAIVRPNLLRWLQAEIADRDPGATLQLLDRLSAPGEDMGVLQYVRGEVYRYRDSEGDAARALEAYTQSTAQPDGPVVAWRQIGVIQRRTHDDAAAAVAFRRYLELAPDAPDKQLIENTLTAIGGTSQ